MNKQKLYAPAFLLFIQFQTDIDRFGNILHDIIGHFLDGVPAAFHSEFHTCVRIHFGIIQFISDTGDLFFFKMERFFQI